MRAGKRVLFTSAPYVIGGVERLVCSLTREFTRRGWQAELVFPEHARKTGVLEWCRRQGVEAEASPLLFPHDGGSYGRRDILSLRSLICQKRPDIVSMHYGDNFLSLKDAIAIRSAGCRHLIASVHNTSPWGADAESQHKRKMTRQAATLCEAVVPNSRATGKVLLDAEIPARKVKRIWCGVAPPSTPLPKPATLREQFDIPPNTFVIGAIARLVEIKGIQFLLEAAAQFWEAHPDARILLRIAGEGPFRPALEAMAREWLPPGMAQFLGLIERLDDFYPTCDVIALPSLKEGFGMVFVEAAFRGVPSIGSGIDGVPDVIQQGVTGFLIPPADVPALARALATLYADPGLRRRMGEAARTRAYAEFTEEIMADRYERLFLGQAPPEQER